MSSATYDVVIIGAGPAGLSAATEAARTGLKTFCIDKLAPGGVLINLGALHDFEDGVDGPTSLGPSPQLDHGHGAHIGAIVVVGIDRQALFGGFEGSLPIRSLKSQSAQEFK